jgi:hypothetical protein
MTGLRTISNGCRRVILALLVVAVVATGLPVIEVHAHDDATYGHSHDLHDHSHGLPETPDTENGDDPESTDAAALHAHADGCVSVGLTSSLDAEISMPAWGRSYTPRPASRPPDKPVRPLYRPPIA